MYYFLTASKDASIFLQQPTQNTGLDEILEVSKVYYGSLKDIARSLVKFDTNTLSASLASGDVTMSVAELVLRETEPTEIPPEPNDNVAPSSLICSSPLANSKPLFAARSTAMVSGDVEVSIAIPSPPWNPSIIEPETMV